MAEQYKHTCECGKIYFDNDPEVYFCADCIESRKAIARQVDAKLANRPKKVQLSSYQIALAKGRTVNSANGGQATFVRAEDIGLTFN